MHASKKCGALLNRLCIIVLRKLKMANAFMPVCINFDDNEKLCLHNGSTTLLNYTTWKWNTSSHHNVLYITFSQTCKAYNSIYNNHPNVILAEKLDMLVNLIITLLAVIIAVEATRNEVDLVSENLHDQLAEAQIRYQGVSIIIIMYICITSYGIILIIHGNFYHFNLRRLRFSPLILCMYFNHIHVHV